MRMGLRAAVLGPAALLAAPAMAQKDAADQQVERGPIPAWVKQSEPLALPDKPSGLAFVRAQDVLVHLDAKGKSAFFRQQVVLLQPQALQFGNIAMSWNPASGKPVVHTVKIRRGAETIDVLDKARFEVVQREDRLEQAVLSGTLTAILKVPDLRVGDELEYAYSLPTADPTLRDKSTEILTLAGTTFPGRYHLGIAWEGRAAPQIRSTDDFSAPVAASANALDLRVDNPPTLNPPKDAPPRYGWQRLIEISDFATWGELSQRFAQLYVEAAKLGLASPLKAEAAKIAANNKTAFDRAQAALALVQNQVRYVYVGLNGGNLRPANADDTWQRRYGDCKAKTALLLALLGELGVPAQAVVVRNEGSDDGFDKRLPTPALFDHVLVRATIDGKPYWLDGTLPMIATASTSPALPYHWVLPLDGKGKQGIEQIPWRPATVPDSVALYEIDARAGFTAPAHKVTRSITRGSDGLVEYFRLSALSDEQLLQGLRSNLAGGSEWNAIDSASYHYDKTARASILEISGSGPIDWDDDGNGKRSLALPGGGFSPPDRRQRGPGPNEGAPYYDAPVYTCHVTTVRLPNDTKPENWSFNTAFDTMLYGHLYYRTFERRGATIRMIRGSRTAMPEIDKAQADRDNVRLPRFDNSMAWINYTPNQAMVLPSPKIGVPATFEGDWVNAADACLPPDLREKGAPPAASISKQ